MDYKKQAEDFLLSANTVFKAEKAIPQKSPIWAQDGKHGTHYSITLSKYEKVTDDRGQKLHLDMTRPIKSIQFDFWNSLFAKERAENGKSDKPNAYDVLSGLYPFDTDNGFEYFCDTYGFNHDSIKAITTYDLSMELNDKLKSLFTPHELEKLAEIQ